jgi:hypothetical protein
MTKRLVVATALAMAVGVVRAQAATCGPVSGKFTEHILPKDSAPTDVAGRVLGNVDGTLQGSTTAFLTSIEIGLNGDLHVTTNNVFLTDEGNQLFTRGDANWREIMKGFYQVELTLQVVGGTGKFTGASGSIKTLGVGNNVGPGSGMFLQEYRGEVCTQ